MNFPDYITKLKSILDRIIDEQTHNIRQAGEMVADSIANGGVVHTFGTGHSHIIAEEAFFRAGGIAAINPILDERFLFLKGALESTRAERESGIAGQLIADQDVRPGDTAIIISNSGRNAAPVEMALEMKHLGIPVIAITSLEQSRASISRHVSGKRLFEIADVTIDNCVPPGDALITIRRMDSATGASSTVAGSAIIHSIVIEAINGLYTRGITPPVLPSANLESTKPDALKEILRPYAGRIRYLDIETEIDE